MDIARRLLALIIARKYRLTDHALDSLDEHDLELADVRECLSTGILRRAWPRDKKYEIDGNSIDGRNIRTVLRLIAPNLVRIITVYEVD